MEMIFEILFEIIIDGSLQAISDKKVPLILRILSAAVLLIVYGGLVGFCLFLGVHDKNILFVILGIGLLLFFGYGFIKVRRNRRY